MNRTPSHRAPHTTRPIWSWGLALFSALLLSPGAANALLHCWAQQSAVLHSAHQYLAQPRRDNDAETLYAAAETAPDPAPRDEPAPTSLTASAPRTLLRPASVPAPDTGFAAPRAARTLLALSSTAPRAPPVL